MPDEEIVLPDTPIEPVEEPVETPAIETPEDSPEEPEVDVEALKATNKKLYERTKKAEADLKALKEGAQPAKPSSQPSVEETVLLANGMPEELVKELKVIAQLRKTTLLKAQNDPIFVAVKETFEKDQKQKQASMGASRGAGAVRPKKTFNTPGLSREEHRAMVTGQ